MENSKDIKYDLNGINWEMLKNQKEILIKMITSWKLIHKGSAKKMNEANEMEGLLSLIDNIQDHAVDVMGIDEKKVFNLTDD